MIMPLPIFALFRQKWHCWNGFT